METIAGGLLATCIGGATLAGLVAYHAAAGYYHYRYYVLRRHEPETWKCQPKSFPTPRQHRTAVLVGTRNMILSGVLTGILVYGVVTGALKTPIYTDVAEYGWAYTLGMTVVLFVMTDCINYWVHRALHIKFLFKHVHRFHLIASLQPRLMWRPPCTRLSSSRSKRRPLRPCSSSPSMGHRPPAYWSTS